MVSPFIDPGFKTSANGLAIALLSRDTYQPALLEQSTGAVDGYAEGATLNTRFGSFPHTTLLDVPWGSQIRASNVDTGSRGRKRKLEGTDEDASTPGPEDQPTKQGKLRKAAVASSGFIHLLRPSPELWTSSLPHRTQVVYTPDYSYILHRIRARPGTRIIEAGAGSGSFTHASARAVFNGEPRYPKQPKGQVFSFEFNEMRFHKMQDEIKAHQLNDLVQINHRNVYKDGFLVDGQSPQATAIFLDLPAPWEALQHLARRRPLLRNGESGTADEDWVSPLDPTKSVHICTFSPCIEQVTRTVEELRSTGWIDVDMVEVSHRRYNFVRDRVGLSVPNEKGFSQIPADVDEAISRLKEVNKKNAEYHKIQTGGHVGAASEAAMDVDGNNAGTEAAEAETENGSTDNKSWLQGRLVHRVEPDLKTHTSYLVFATLPQEWSEEEEAAALAKWPCGKESKTIGSLDKQARKQEKRDVLEARKRQKKENKEAAA